MKGQQKQGGEEIQVNWRPYQCYHTEDEIRKYKLENGKHISKRTLANYVWPYCFCVVGRSEIIKRPNSTKKYGTDEVKRETSFNSPRNRSNISREQSPNINKFIGATHETEKSEEDEERLQWKADAEVNTDQIQTEDKEVNTDPTVVKRELVRNPRVGSFFQGDVLEDEQDTRQFLTEIVEKAKDQTIRLTRLLFRFDTRNKANIHLYVDGFSDVMFIGRTIGGFLIAAYSEVAPAQRMAVGGCAFLASLTNRRVYPLAASKKALTYDPIFLIFGNSEVRVSADRAEVYSNFGVTSGVYTARGDKVDCFLGEGQAKETGLQYYELHQVVYK